MLSIPHLSASARARRCLADDTTASTDDRRLVVVRRPAPRPLRLALEQDERHASSSQRRVRRVVSRNCRNLQRFGYEHAAFHRRSAAATGPSNEQRMAAALHDIQQQVAALERRRALLESLHLTRYANARQLAAHKTREYYEHFASGFDPRVPDRSRLLESIVRSVLLENVQSPAFATIDQFLRQWANYSKYHAKVTVTIQSIEPLEEDNEAVSDGDAVVIKCAGLTTFRISRETIEHFFQPVMNDEALVQQLIGKEYCFPFVTLFHFATDSGRVFRMEPRADLAAGLFSLVSDPFATVKLLRASQLTSDGLLNAYPAKPDTTRASRPADVVEIVGDAA